MADECEINVLLGVDGPCPVCAALDAPRPAASAWEERRARASVPEPDPFVLAVAS